MDTLTLESIGIGIALSAACGFRIFIPPLVMSLAAIYGHLPLASGFEWIGTYPALLAFGAATIVEIAGYYIPLVDNLLDTVATPTAIAFGTWVAAALFPDSDPLLQWTMAVIAGGGSAGIIQALTGFTRLSSTALTVGIGNNLVATIESIGAVTLSALAIVLPFLAVGLVFVFLVFGLNRGLQVLATKRQS